MSERSLRASRDSAPTASRDRRHRVRGADVVLAASHAGGHVPPLVRVDGCEIGEQTGELTLQARSHATGHRAQPAAGRDVRRVRAVVPEKTAPGTRPTTRRQGSTARTAASSSSLADGDSSRPARRRRRPESTASLRYPPGFADLSSELVTHSSAHGDLAHSPARRSP